LYIKVLWNVGWKMDKKGEIFKTIILFLFFLFGCSHKYVDAEGESLDEQVVDSWEELDCKVVEQDERGFSLGLEVRDIIVVEDSVKSRKLYSREFSEKGPVLPLFGAMIGIVGGIGGCYYGLHNNISWDGYDKDQFDRGCLISFASCFTGAGMMFMGLPNSSKRKAIKAIPDFIKRDTVCIYSMFLIKQKIKVLVEDTDLEKIYLTDDNGNVELKFDEIISEPTDADSILDLIIRYYEMVDTVRVGSL
jgi:hypothetical protein